MSDATMDFFARLCGESVVLTTIGSGDASQGCQYRGVLLDADSLGVVLRIGECMVWVNLRDVASAAQDEERGVGGGP